MCSDYDENLQKNPFFIEICTNYNDKFQEACTNNWLICIPRAGSLEISEITVDTISNHVLKPGPPQEFSTLSGRSVCLKNKHLYSPHPEECLTKILFEETLYLKEQKCKLVCLQDPLFTKGGRCHGHRPAVLETLHDCIDYLWGENLGPALTKIQELCDNFSNHNKTDFLILDLQSQKDYLGKFYSDCLQVCLRDRIADFQEDPSLTRLKLAVETYMQSCLGDTLTRAVNTVMSSQDCQLNKIIQNLTTVQLRDLNIPSNLCDTLASAKFELRRINNYHTILDKLNCLKNAFACLYTNSSPIDPVTTTITSDMLIQICIFLLIKTNVANWSANLVFLTQYNFSTNNSTSSENCFLTTTLEASLEFLRTRGLILDKKVDTPDFFRCVLNNDLPGLRKVISKRKSGGGDVAVRLCHPLCDCSHCSKTTPGNSFFIDALQTVNNSGQNLVIVATILGKSRIVEYLVSLNVDLNFRDYHGKTALHYANLHGFQDILLILVNAKSDPNSRDNDSNTPLHLSCNGGHENCVKAMLYTCKNLEVNSPNRRGDTPLHLAVKFNFYNIAKILLENQARKSVHMCNKNRLKVPDLSQNFYIDRLLRHFCDSQSPQNNSGILEIEVNHKLGVMCFKEHGVRPKTVSIIKKVDLLLKSIENNDAPLTSFYLGFSNVSKAYDWRTKCHPLCNCEKCERADEKPDFSSPETVEDLNVNFCNVDGFTAIHVAAKFGRLEILRVLLDCRAFINVKTYKTLQTPLHLACIHGRLNVVKELISCGDCEVDPQDYKGNTPMYYACLQNDPRIVETLLSNGADGNIKNYMGGSVVKEVQENQLFGVSKFFPKVTCRSTGVSDDANFL